MGLLLFYCVGVVCHWSVKYTIDSLCALEGSSVNLSCTYSYPSDLTVKDAFWVNEDSDFLTDFSKYSNYTKRVSVDCKIKSNMCHLHLQSLTIADAHHKYYCRITSNKEREKWIGKPGVKLSVTGEVTEFFGMVKQSTMFITPKTGKLERGKKTQTLTLICSEILKVT